METRIIEFGVVPSDILAMPTGNGYEVDVCVTSISKLKKALQQLDDLDAIALAEKWVPKSRKNPRSGSFHWQGSTDLVSGQ